MSVLAFSIRLPLDLFVTVFPTSFHALMILMLSFAFSPFLPFSPPSEPTVQSSLLRYLTYICLYSHLSICHGVDTHPLF